VNPIAKDECPTDDLECYSFYNTERSDMMMMMLQAKSIICAITLLIAVGSFVGTLKPCQYVVIGELFACCYSLNKRVIIGGDAIKNVVDPGGALAVHEFAASCGMSVGLAIHEKRCFSADLNWITHSIGWVWLSAAFLFVMWPSFVTMFYSGPLAVEAMSVCYFGGIGSGITCLIA
jgi:ammonium transporter Rh